MNTFRICVVILFSLWNFFVSATPGMKPTGLMTDLAEHTDRVYMNGYLSELTLLQTDKAIEPVQFTEILSEYPSFSWIVPGKDRAVFQSAYHIILADSFSAIQKEEGLIWNSTKTESSQSVAVPYTGKALQPGKVYFWKVKIWNNRGEASEWSEVKAFRTGKKLYKYASPSYPLVKTVDHPLTLSSDGNSVWLADFGKDAFGQLKLTLTSEHEHDTVWIHLGEKKEGNKVCRTPGGTIRYQCYKLPLQKGRHSYHIKILPDKRNTGSAAVKMPAYIGEVLPFRYCEVERYDKPLKITDFCRESVHYPFDETASFFHCDNDTLNQIWELCKYSVKATSFAGIYVDGDRERIPYEADALINQLCHYGVDREYTLARKSHEYLLEHPTWPTEWIMQAVLIAWYDYLYTGDSRSLAAHYEILKARTLMQLKDKTGLISTVPEKQTPAFLASIRFNGKIKDIVDWPHTGILGLEKSEGGEADGFVFTEYNAVTNAYHYEAMKIMAEIAGVVGNKEEADYFEKQCEEFKKVYNRTFFNSRQKYYQDGKETVHASLHSNMFAVAFDLLPSPYQKPVMDFIRSRKMACSVYGAQFLMDALYKAGEAGYALSLLTATHDRSWYNMLKAGSTISMEAWDDKYKPNQDWNHAWGAVPANIIPRSLVGVKPLEPGCGVIEIKPQIATLKSVRAIVPTIRGSVDVKIDNKMEDGKYDLQVTIPANMKAEVYLPFLSKKQNVWLDGEKVTVHKVKGEPFVYAGTISSGTYWFKVK